ncbi:hypothetical protein K438DRAFT_1786280 [Mycena galopus ATCC 62051]|nr:hypothetical protein K438DRAFT_1786280 [Mycena galopus ATCC 62051]
MSFFNLSHLFDFLLTAYHLTRMAPTVKPFTAFRGAVSRGSVYPRRQRVDRPGDWIIVVITSSHVAARQHCCLDGVKLLLADRQWVAVGDKETRGLTVDVGWTYLGEAIKSLSNQPTRGQATVQERPERQQSKGGETEVGRLGGPEVDRCRPTRQDRPRSTEVHLCQQTLPMGARNAVIGQGNSQWGIFRICE